MNQSEKQQYWTSVIEKQTVSELSIPAFCKANDLSYPTFHYWLNISPIYHHVRSSWNRVEEPTTARVFQRSGHTVKLISPQFVKPFVKTNKNDANDAEDITEAASRPSMHFVPIKQVEQQDIQSLHRIRSRLVKNRTVLINEIRGLNLEYGNAIPTGALKVRAKLCLIISDKTMN